MKKEKQSQMNQHKAIRTSTKTPRFCQLHFSLPPFFLFSSFSPKLTIILPLLHPKNTHLPIFISVFPQFPLFPFFCFFVFFVFFLMRRSIATCYSEHAVKVSDSYCSGPSPNPHVFSKFPSSNSPLSVSSIYRAKLSASNDLLILLHWTAKDLGQSFKIKINSISLPILTTKGLKSFKFDHNSEISVFWDISDARFDPGPDPSSGFYIAVTVDSEIALLMGDEREKLVKLGVLKENTDTQLLKFSLVSRKEDFCGDDSVFLTKARFSDEGGDHEIVVKCGGGGEEMRNQRLAVFIDKKQVFEVKRLKWNFRGNQTIFLDGSVVDMMWDVYDWLFRPESAAGAAFMFRKRSGLDSRLWLEEKTKQEKPGFSLLIRACKNNLLPPS